MILIRYILNELRVKKKNINFILKPNTKFVRIIIRELVKYQVTNKKVEDNTTKGQDEVLQQHISTSYDHHFQSTTYTSSKQMCEDYDQNENKRRHSQIEVRFKRNSLQPYDHNTYDVHLPPSKEELNNSVLVTADMPAPPPSAMSVISPPNSSGSNSNRIFAHSSSTLASSNVKQNKDKRLEIHKNISAVVKQLSMYVTRKKPNDVLPLETLPSLPTVSSTIDSNHPDFIDTKNANAASNINKAYHNTTYQVRFSPQDFNQLNKTTTISGHSVENKKVATFSPTSKSFLEQKYATERKERYLNVTKQTE